MAIKTNAELLEQIKSRLGEDSSDEALSFIEDVTDTLNNYESITADTNNWKKRYEDNDKEWREKYKARFFNPEPDKGVQNEPQTYGDDEPAVLTYDKLFKEE